MQRQLVRQQMHSDKVQEHAQSILSNNQQQTGKQSHSSKNGHQLMRSLKQNENVKSVEQSNHLQALHTKLNSEADKILKWKVCTELEISQKEKKLTETEEIVERQRKNLFELQMHSEQLSQRLSIELKNREELSSKIENTRIICNIVRDHCAQLTRTLNVCVGEKDNLKVVYSEQMKDIEQLQENYRKIEANFKAEIEQLEELVREERNQRNKLINEANATHVLLSERIEDMDKKLSADKIKFNSLEIQYLQSSEKIKKLTEEVEDSNNKLISCEGELIDIKQQLSEQKEKFLLKVSDALSKLQEETIRSNLLKKQYEHAQENILHLEAARDKTISENSILKESLESLNIIHTKTVEDLKKISDECSLILNEKNKLMEMVKCLEEVQGKFIVMENDYKCLMEEKQLVAKELGNASEKLLIMENKNKDNEVLLEKCLEEKYELTVELSLHKESMESLNEKLKCSESLGNEMKQNISVMELELTSARSQLVTLQSKLELQTSELSALMEKAHSDVLKKDGELELLQVQLKESEICVCELQNQQKTQLEQIKCLEDENVMLRKSVEGDSDKIEILNSEKRETSEKIHQLSKDLEEAKSKSDEISAMIDKYAGEKLELERQLSDVNETLEKVSKERKDFEKKHLDVVKEKEDLQLKSDSEIKEMVAVLEKYKRECDGIVNQKEANIAKLSDNFEAIQKVNEDLQDQIVNLQKENNSSQRKIADLNKEKDIIEKTLQVQLMDLELKLTAKDKEMAEIQVALLKSGTNKQPYSDNVFSTPSKITSPKMEDTKMNFQTPKSCPPTMLHATPHQYGSILKETNTPGGTKKQVTFQEDNSDTDASSVDAMIIDNTDLISRFEALERGVKMMTPIRVLPSPKNRRKSEHKKIDSLSKNMENDPDYHSKKAKLMWPMEKKDDADKVLLKGKRYRDGGGLKQFFKSKHSCRDAGRNTGLDLDELFEMVED